MSPELKMRVPGTQMRASTWLPEECSPQPPACALRRRQPAKPSPPSAVRNSSS